LKLEPEFHVCTTVQEGDARMPNSNPMPGT
jgi:hypothetical protein